MNNTINHFDNRAIEIFNKLPEKYKNKLKKENIPFHVELNPEKIGNSYIRLNKLDMHIIEVSLRKKTSEGWKEHIGNYNPSYYSFHLNENNET